MRPLLFAVAVFLVTGCSNHPLQDDVTGYTTHDIVQKLRCEAQVAVIEQLKKRNFSAYQERVLDLYKKSKKYREFRLKNDEIFAEIDKRDQANLLTTKANEKDVADLTRNAKTIESERKQLELLIAQADERMKASLTARIASLHERETILTSKILALNEEYKKITSANEKAEVDHDKALKPFGLTHKAYIRDKADAEFLDKALSAATPDSASLQKIFAKNDPISLRELFSINRTTLSMKLDFKITEDNNANASGALTWPIHLGSVSLTYKAGTERGRVAQRVVQVTSTFQELSDQETLKCPLDGRDPHDRRAYTYPVVGNVGVGELIKQYFSILKDATIVVATGQDTFTDNLAFTTKISGGLNPTIEIKPVHPSLVKAGLDLNSDRTDLHQVALQVRPYSPTNSPSDPKLEITKIPSVTVNITEGPDGHGSSIGVK